MAIKTSTKNFLRKCLTLFMAFCMIFSALAMSPIAAQAAGSDPVALSAEVGATASTDKKLSEYPNGLQLMNDTGWYFDDDFKITWAGESGQYWLNGKQISYTDGEMTMNILRYTDSENNSYRASFFVYNGSFGLYWVEPSNNGIPNYYEFNFPTHIPNDIVQYESPQSADDLYVTADGYIYYKFTHIIGDKAGTTDVYYLSSNGFSDTVPGSDVAVQFEIEELNQTIETEKFDLSTYSGGWTTYIANKTALLTGQTFPTYSNGTIKLVEETQNRATAIWTDKLSVGNNFSFAAEVTITEGDSYGTGDGFAVLLASNPYLGSGGGFLGFLGGTTDGWSTTSAYNATANSSAYGAYVDVYNGVKVGAVNAGAKGTESAALSNNNKNGTFYIWMDYNGTDLTVKVGKSNDYSSTANKSQTISNLSFNAGELYLGFTAGTGDSTCGITVDKCVLIPYTEGGANVVELTELDEYPYGTEMYSYDVTLNVDTVGTTYQWQMADSKDGTYTNISDATGKTYYIDHDAYTDKWFRCIIDGTKVTKSVELFHSYSTNYSLVGVSGSDDKWYVSNGVMAYTNNTYEKQFDVLGMYQGYWINASYCGSWYIGADKKTEPDENSYYPYSASIDTVKLTFSNTDDRQVHISVKLQSGYRSLAIGTDTAINSIDQCPLNAIKNPDGSLAFVQIVNASSLASITDSDESMTFTPVTPANAWWCGSYYNANNGLAWPEINSDSVEDDDSAMAVSWTNLASGSTVDFIMSLGTVEQTGASSETVIGGSTITTQAALEAAIANAADGDVIKLEGDIDLTTALNIAAGKNIVLDLNGYTLTGPSSSYWTVNVEATAKLTVTDSGIGGKITGCAYGIQTAGEVVVTGGTVEGTTAGIFGNAATADVTVSGGIVKGTNTTTSYGITTFGTTEVEGGTISGAIGVYNNGGNLTVSAGTVTGTNYGVQNINNGTVIVSGGTVTGNTGVANSGTLNVQGGTIEGTGSDGITNGYNGNAITTTSGIVNMTGGYVKGADYAICDYASGVTGNTISGGKLEAGTHILTSYESNVGGTWTVAEGGEILVKLTNSQYGPTNIPSYINYVADEYFPQGQVTVTNKEYLQISPTGDSDSFYTLTGGDAELEIEKNVKVGDKTYATIEEAIADAGTDAIVIELTGDVTMSAGATIPEGVNVTINGNGYTITRGEDCTDTLFAVTGGTLSMENVTIDGGAVWSEGDTPADRTNSGVQIVNPAQGVGLLIRVDSGSVTLNETTLQNNDRVCNDDNIGDDGSAVQVSNGSFTMTDSTIKDCSVSGKDTAGNQSDVDVGDGAAITIWGGTATITGGEIEGNYGSRHGGVSRVNGGTLTLDGVNIHDNYTNGDLGNIAITGGTLKVAGDLVVDNNYDVDGDTVTEANIGIYSGYLAEGDTELSEGANIGLSVGYTTSGQTVMTGAEEGDEAYFTVDGAILATTYSNGSVVLTDTIKVSTQDELVAAINAGYKNITLTSDINLTAGITIPAGKEVNIYGNGYTLKRDSSYTGTLFTVTDGSLSLENVTVDGGAIWKNADGSAWTDGGNAATRVNEGVVSTGQLIEIYGSGSVTLGDKATLQNNHRTNSSPQGADRGSAVVVYGTGSFYMDEDATIKDCTVNDATNPDNIVGDGAAIAVHQSNGKEVVISGTIMGNYSPRMGGAIRVFQNAAADITIKDATITGNYTNDNMLGAVCLGSNTNVSVSGTVVIDGNYTASGSAANVGANGGTLTEGEDGLADGSKISLLVTTDSNNFSKNSVVLKDAEAEDVGYFVTDGDVMGIAYENETLVVASIIDSLSRLEYAIANAADGEVITLDGNIAGSVTIPEGKNIVLDLNGYTIDGGWTATVTNYGTLTVRDTSDAGTGTITGRYGISNHSALTVESGTLIGTGNDGIFNAATATNLTVTGGTIKGNNLAICDYAQGGSFSLENCTLECTRTSTGGGGVGYVLGSYGSNIGGEWEIGDGVILKNNCNASQLINTNTETGVAGAGQVTISNWDEIKDSMVAINGQIVVGAKAIVEIDGVQTAFTSMDEAIAAATSATSATITLLADYDKAITIPEDANVTIDLNGHDIVTSGTTIINNGTLTIVNSSDEPATVQGGDYCVNNSGELNINGDSVSDITIFATGNNDTIGNQPGGTIHIDGATIKSNGYYAILDQCGTSGNTIANAHLECGADGSGGAFALGGYNGKGGEWTISEGVTMKNGEASKSEQLINTGVIGYDTPVTIANGDAIALADPDGDGTYTVVAAVAKVTFADGTTKTYATLEEAIAACPENSSATVELLQGVTVDATITILANKDITITGDATILGNVADAPMFKVADGASLTVQGDVTLNAQNKGGIIETSGDVTVTGDAQLMNGKATNGGAISVANGGSVTVEDNATFKNNYASDNGGAIYVAEGGSATVTGGTMTNNKAGGCGNGIYLDNATLELDGTNATAGITDTIGMGGTTPLIEVTSATIDHKVYVEFSDPETQMESGTAFIKGTNETDPLTPEELKSSFRCANASYTFDGTSSEDGLVIGKSNEEYVVWFDKDGTAHSYSDINKALEDMLEAQNNGTLADDATLYFVQYRNDANPELNRTEIELTEAIVIPDGLTVNFGSAVKHTEEDGVTFAYEKGTTANVSPTVVTRADNYLGELIRVEADKNDDGTLASLTITNLTLDGGAVWGEDGEIEITDDGNGTAGSVTNNNTGISASAPVIVNGGNLTLSDGATIQNNDNYYGQAGTGFGSQYYGGGIRNEGEGELTMEPGSTITGCYAREGGAILNINKPGTDGYVENGNPTVIIEDGATITGNASQMKGAAIQTIYSGATDDTTGGATTIINGGTITDNFSLNDLGTLAVEEGGSLTVNGGTISAGSATILGDTDETQNENAIYVYNKYGDDDYAGATNKPYIEGNGAAEIVISGDPTITGDIFLDNPCEVYDSKTVYAPIIDASGYTGESDLNISLENDREFGNAIVIVGDNNEDKININLPDMSDSEGYVQQELIVGEDGTVIYRGYDLDIEQSAAGEITITGTADTDAEKLIITIGGKEVEIAVADGVVNATIDLDDFEGNSFEITKIESEDAIGNKTTLLDTESAGSTDTAIKVDVVKVDTANGEISAPEGTTYVNKDGQIVALENGTIPNDIKIDENGNATFYVDGEEVTVCIGVREEAPVAPDGEVADFDMDSASVTVDAQAGLEYAVVDKDGNIVKGWIKAETDGTITFDGLEADTDYTVIARTPAGADTLPSEYAEVVEFTTLTEDEAADKASFEMAVDAFNNDPTVDNALAVIEKYDALPDEVKALDSVQAAANNALDTVKAAAVADINKTAIDKKAEIDALTNLSDEDKADLKAEIDAEATEAIGNINAATTVADVTTARDNGTDDINGVVTGAVADDLATGKTNAIADINEIAADKKSEIDALANLSDEDKADLKAEIDAEATKAIGNINGATTTADVTTAKDNGTEAIDAIVTDAVADDLAAGKISAIANINEAATDKKAEIDALTNLSNEEKDELKAEIEAKATEAIGNINAATTAVAITTAQEDGIEAINAIVASAVADDLAAGKTDATTAISEAATDKKSAIDALDNLSADEKADLKAAVDATAEAAKTAISNATTPDAVETEKTSGTTAIDLIGDQAVATDAINEVATGKKAEIDALTNLSNEDKANLKAEIDAEATEAISNINSTTTATEVTTAKENGIEAIKGVVTEAVADDLAIGKTNATTAIDQAATDKKSAIDALDNLSDEEKTAFKEAVDSDAEAAKTAISNAATFEAVETEKANGTASIELVGYKAVATDAINKAVSDKKAEIDALTNLSNEDKAELKAEIDSEATEAIDNINNAATAADVTTAQNNGIEAIDSVVTDAVADDLAIGKTNAIAAINDAATNKKSEIEALTNLSDEEKSALKAEIDTAVADAISDINGAATATAVTTAQENGIETIELAHEKAIAIATINKTAVNKADAIDALSSLSDAEKTALKNQIGSAAADAKAAIQSATASDAVELAKNDGVKAINKIVADAIKDDLAAVKSVAKADIDQAVADKKAEIDALTNLSANEKTALKSEIDEAADAAKKVIDDAKNVIGATTAKNDGIAAINAIYVNAVSDDVDTAKAAAIDNIEQVADAKKAEIDALTNLSDTEKTAAKQEVDEEAAKAMAAINAATTGEAVTEAMDNGIAAIQAVAAQAVADDLAASQNAASAAIDAAAAEEKAAIDAMTHLTDAEKAELKEQVDDAVTAAKKAVADATTPEAVEAAEEAAEEALDIIVVKADAMDEINETAENEKSAIDEIAGLTDQQKADLKAVIDEAAADAKDEIDAATTEQDVITVKNAAATEIELGTDKANAIIATEKAAADAKAEINALTHLTDAEKVTYIAVIDQTAEDAVKAIVAAETAQAITTAGTNASAAMADAVDEAVASDFVKAYLTGTDGKIYDNITVENVDQIVSGKTVWNFLTTVQKAKVDEMIAEANKSISEAPKSYTDFLSAYEAGVPYTITSGAEQTVTKGNTAIFVSSAPFGKFVKVLVDGKEVAAANYTAVSGSTKITLSADYINSLSAGEHTLTIVSVDGEATTTFTVKNVADSNSPATGDDTNIVIWIVLAIISAFGIIAVIIPMRKKEKYQH